MSIKHLSKYSLSNFAIPLKFRTFASDNERGSLKDIEKRRSVLSRFLFNDLNVDVRQRDIWRTLKKETCTLQKDICEKKWTCASQRDICEQLRKWTCDSQRNVCENERTCALQKDVCENEWTCASQRDVCEQLKKWTCDLQRDICEDEWTYAS